MAGFDGLFGIHATALKLREQRMGLIASNIANAATPNYKARDLDFGQALSAAEAGGRQDTALRFRVPLQPTLDGNTVDLSMEQSNFSKNSMDFQTSLTFLNAKFQGLKQAIEGR